MRPFQIAKYALTYTVKTENTFLVGTLGLVLVLVMMAGTSFADESTRHIIFETVKNYYENELISETEYMQFLKYMGFDFGFSKNYEIIIEERVAITDSVKDKAEKISELQTEYFEIQNPIQPEKRDEIAKLVVESLGDTLIGLEKEKENSFTRYESEKGRVTVLHNFSYGPWAGAIEYGSSHYVKPADRIELVEAFMENMGFDISDAEIKTRSNTSHTWHSYETSNGFIEFQFGSKTWGGHKVRIMNWITDPNPPQVQITKEKAQDISLDYIRNTELTQIGRDGEMPCNIRESTPGESRIVHLWGEPYYLTTVGYCDDSEYEGLYILFVDVFVNGLDGEHRFHSLYNPEGYLLGLILNESVISSPSNNYLDLYFATILLTHFSGFFSTSCSQNLSTDHPSLLRFLVYL